MVTTRSTQDLGVAGERLVPTVPAATEAAGAPLRATGLDEALRLSHHLVARARRLDVLRNRGPELTIGYQGAFTPLFEEVERAVTDLVRTRRLADPDDTLEGDL